VVITALVPVARTREGQKGGTRVTLTFAPAALLAARTGGFCTLFERDVAVAEVVEMGVEEVLGRVD